MMSEIIAAARAIRAGKLVVFPTETVYGLGADATNDSAVAAVFAAKRRPEINPLIVHVSDVQAAKALVEWTDIAERLAAEFWPGALTLVLERTETSPVSLLASAGLDTLAIRCPSHPLAQELLVKTGLPIVAPSANPAGKLSATEVAHIAAEIRSAAEIVLDSGPSELGIESTVVDARSAPIQILRPGSLSKEDIEEKTGIDARYAADKPAPQSPGQLASHYAPEAEVRLSATEVRDGEALLAFGPVVPDGAMAIRNLSEKGDLVEAAANLFRMLRELDQSGASMIAVMAIPDKGIGHALNDRLKRAAAAR